MIVCVGIAARDTIYALARHPEPDDHVIATTRVVAGGGPAATAAVTIARLGAPVRFVGAVDDLDGVEVVRTPGHVVESTILVGSGTRAIVTIEPEPLTLEPDALDGADWIHLDQQGYPAWRALGASGAKVSLDASTPIDGLSLDGIELYAPSEQTDDGRRAPLTVVTRGADGCTAYTEGETIDVPGFPVEAVSTLGAGDVFHGALLACLWRELSLRDALRHANACAALSCRALDGRSAIPSWDELEAALG